MAAVAAHQPATAIQHRCTGNGEKGLRNDFISWGESCERQVPLVRQPLDADADAALKDGQFPIEVPEQINLDRRRRVWCGLAGWLVGWQAQRTVQ
jgi:hypothetical protein